MFRLAPFVVGGLAAALGLFDLGRNELNSAEATSFFIARLDWGDTWTSLSTSEANGSPFYLLLHFWSGLGDTEFILRILPLLFGVATPVVLYRLIARLFGPAYGLGAAGLLAINAFFVAHMQNLRSYSMSAFLATAATLLFVKVIEDRTRLAAIGYALTGALLVYAHFFGAMVLLVHALSLLLLEKEKIPRKELLTTYGALAVLVVPVGVFVLSADVGQIDWIPELSAHRLRLGLGDLAGLGGNVQLAVYGVLSAVAVVLAVRFRREARGSRRSWATSLIVMWLFLPLLGTILISFLKPLFEARYLLIALPPLATCAVLALGSIKLRAGAIAAFVLTAALTASQLPGWYLDFNEPEWGNRADLVFREGTPEDGIIFYAPPIIRPFGYHYGFYTSDVVHPEIIYPGKNWLGYSRSDYDLPWRSIIDSISADQQIWLVLGADKDEERLDEERDLITALTLVCGNPRTWFDKEVALFEDCGAGP